MRKKMRRIQSLLMTFVLVLVFALSAKPQTADAADSLTGPYTIVSALSSYKCTSAEGVTIASGSNISLNSRNSSAAQCFYIKDEGNSYISIRSYADDTLAFSLKDGMVGNKVSVVLNRYSAKKTQLWKLVATGKKNQYYIKSKAGEYYLHVSGGKTANGTDIYVYKLTQANAQRWKLVKAYDAEAAISYALKYSDNSGKMDSTTYNPEYNKYSPYATTDLLKGYDCSNFISQCLYAGGIRETNGWRRVLAGQQINSKNGNVAFVNVSALYNYLTNTLGYKCERITDLTQIRRGDIVFMDTKGDNIVNHASICTNQRNSYRYFTAHSNWRRNWLYSFTQFKIAYVIHMPF